MTSKTGNIPAVLAIVLLFVLFRPNKNQDISSLPVGSLPEIANKLANSIYDGEQASVLTPYEIATAQKSQGYTQVSIVTPDGIRVLQVSADGTIQEITL